MDSIGIRKNEIINGNLHVKLGYIVNCSWDQGYLRNIKNRNDTLFIEVERLGMIDTTHIDSTKFIVEKYVPLTECSCFFFFDLQMEAFNKPPKSIKISPYHNNKAFFDEVEIMEIEETIIE